jgi:serine/threonine protein kinase/TolB-like protein
MPLEVGSRLGCYEIIAELGSGGMGQVYRAHDTKLGRQVAIKILHQEVAQDKDTLSRFQREARALAQLNIPSVATIYDLVEADGLLFLVMELVPGQTLAERLRSEGPLPLREALTVGLHVAEALEASHEKGIVHRDLKPANIKITPDGKTKLLDFGLAKSLAGSDAGSGHDWVTLAPTQPGVVMGTPPYMSPEQTRGQDVDKRTDIWAFGCVLYETLAGRRAFGGHTVSDVLASIIEREPDWSALPATTPDDLRKLIQRCLVKDPARRLRDIGEARIMLEELTRDFARTQEIVPTERPRATAPGSSPNGTAGGDEAIKAAARDAAAPAAAPDPGSRPSAPSGRTLHLAEPAPPPSHLGLFLLFGLVFLATVGAAYFFLFLYGKSTHTVAVLPFTFPDGGDGNLAELAKTMTGRLTTSLSQTPALKVISSDSGQLTQLTSNSDPKEAGRRLGVQAVLTGHINKRRNGYSLDLRLVDVETGHVLWSEEPSLEWETGSAPFVRLDQWAEDTAKNVNKNIDK